MDEARRAAGRKEPAARNDTTGNEPAGSRRALSATRPIPRRGLSRVEAAQYIGIGTSKFDAMVADGRMPVAKRIDGRKVWDMHALDLAFDALPTDDTFQGRNTWDDV
jgi:predicted DNA-binding transcriptional regulator AlpA